MGTGFEHTALAVFTTLAPMGAGAFIALAYAFIAGARSPFWRRVSSAPSCTSQAR